MGSPRLYWAKRGEQRIINTEEWIMKRRTAVRTWIVAAAIAALPVGARAQAEKPKKAKAEDTATQEALTAQGDKLAGLEATQGAKEERANA